MFVHVCTFLLNKGKSIKVIHSSIKLKVIFSRFSDQTVLPSPGESDHGEQSVVTASVFQNSVSSELNVNFSGKHNDDIDKTEVVFLQVSVELDPSKGF